MRLELDETEKAYLLELLKEAHQGLLHELHHTDTKDYKTVLKTKIGIQESIQKKLEELR